MTLTQNLVGKQWETVSLLMDMLLEAAKDLPLRHCEHNEASDRTY